MIYSLHKFALGGTTLTPTEQDIIQASRLVEQFLAQTTDRLIIIIVGLFVVFLILGAVVTLYLLRNMGGRDKTANTVIEKLSEIISQQNKSLEQQDRIIEQRDTEYRSLFVQVSERNEKADLLHTKSAETLSSISLYTQEALKEVVSRQVRNLEVLSEHDKRAAQGIKDIVTAIEGVEKKMDTAIEKLDSLALRFPSKSEWDERVNEIRKELTAAKQACEDAKKSTDEKPLVTLPAPDVDSEAAA